MELVEGYGVFCSQRQLDAAIDGAGASPTKLMRNLLSIFFAPHILAVSSARGTKNNSALDQDILDSCIRKLHIHAFTD